MTALWKLKPEDRVMVLAPHPDDETLAAGGLLQKAVAASAAVHVVCVTDGDNNPWPQRVSEQRWRITAADRVRWGARRRREARAGLACLGVAADSVRFLGYPDQGLSPLLYRGDEDILQTLATEIGQWQPTLLVTPSALDLHPDHNALAVLCQLAFTLLDPERRDFTQMSYLVHENQPGLADLDWLYLPLRSAELARKHEAIRCHTSQLVLSKRRFLAFAQEVERFITSLKPIMYDRRHPVRRATVTDGFLRFEITTPSWTDAHCRMTLHLIAFGTGTEVRGYFVELPRMSAQLEVRDAASGAVLAHGHFYGTRKQGDLVLPLSPLLAAQRVLVKVERHFGFFDVAGWREFVVSRPACTDVPLLPSRSEQTQSHLRVCCVIPCYNVATLCGEVIHEATKYADVVIAVNDGSSDGTEHVLRRIAAEHDGRIRILSLARNCGKGAALLAGFRYALTQAPFDVLVTLDGDRQHCAADIPRLVEVWRTERATLVIGERDQFAAMPLRSRVGNALISRLLRCLYPAGPRDTQSGFRAFDRSFVAEVVEGVRGGRYETELHMLAFALRAQRKVGTVSIPTVYLNGNRSSHFRPLVDSLRVFLTLLRWRHFVPTAEMKKIDESYDFAEERQWITLPK